MKFKILTYIAISALCLASCDINDVENVYEMSQSTFPQTEDDANAVLAGIYQNLNTTHANPQCSYLYLACLASDDQLGGGGTNDKLMQAEDLMLSSTADMTNQFYADRYSGIAHANVLIDVLKNAETAVQKQALGEALALRAFYYYELASMYGNVPLVRNSDEAENKQGDVTVLWGQILKDFVKAIEYMSNERKSDGHLDKYATEGLLARAWLFYTGMYCNGTELSGLTSTTYNPLTEVTLPADNEEEKPTVLTEKQVIEYIDDCVAHSGYELVPDFRNLWAYTNRLTVEDYDYTKGQGLKWVEDDGGTNPESMFAIKFNKQASWSTTIGYANGIALHFAVRGSQPYADTFPFGQGWGAGPVAQNLVTDWVKEEPSDMRRAATIQDWNASQTYTWGGGNDYVQETGYYGKKWSPITNKRDDDTYGPTFENDMYPDNWDISGEDNFQLGNIHDLVLLRFADVLLMQSELKKDVSGINAVRRRAGLKEIDTYSLEALQNERRWELACEGIRWNDIRRWHIAAAALEKQTDTEAYYCGTKGKNTAHNGGYASRYNATAGFTKMPETQIALGTVVQNPGWDGAISDYSGW